METLSRVVSIQNTGEYLHKTKLFTEFSVELKTAPTVGSDFHQSRKNQERIWRQRAWIRQTSGSSYSVCLSSPFICSAAGTLPTHM